MGAGRQARVLGAASEERGNLPLWPVCILPACSSLQAVLPDDSAGSFPPCALARAREGRAALHRTEGCTDTGTGAAGDLEQTRH